MKHAMSAETWTRYFWSGGRPGSKRRREKQAAYTMAREARGNMRRGRRGAGGAVRTVFTRQAHDVLQPGHLRPPRLFPYLIRLKFNIMMVC